MSNNYLYGPLPDYLFDKCVNQIDVSNNSLYGRVNRDFKNMVADGGALINLAHNFFFGDAVLFAAGCKVCPTEITEPNSLDMGDTNDGQGAGNPEAACPSNATQRSTAACQAFCSITDNGPCDGHGACVPPAPASPSNFTCLCDAGYSAVDLGNGSTCAIVNSTTTTTTVSSLSTGAIVGIAVGCFTGSTLLAAVVAWLLWPRGPSASHGLSPPHASRSPAGILRGPERGDGQAGADPGARKKMETFHQDDLKDSKMPAVSKDAIVDIADLALDCMKSPGTRRPSMKDVAYRLTALIEKYCPDKEDDSEILGKEESASSGGLPSRNISSMLFGDGGRDSQRTSGSHPSAISSMSIGSMADGVRAMASLHHMHLVRLLGFCVDQNVETGKQEQILVYEFVGNRDMEYHIYKTKSEF
ncbi:unnamed protein product [Closterium sp. Naga37s-1]|nr:unnamed protein product [Closterium sp. Naga37s-1]